MVGLIAQVEAAGLGAVLLPHVEPPAGSQADAGAEAAAEVRVAEQDLRVRLADGARHGVGGRPRCHQRRDAEGADAPQEVLGLCEEVAVQRIGHRAVDGVGVNGRRHQHARHLHRPVFARFFRARLDFGTRRSRSGRDVGAGAGVGGRGPVAGEEADLADQDGLVDGVVRLVGPGGRRPGGRGYGRQCIGLDSPSWRNVGLKGLLIGAEARLEQARRSGRPCRSATPHPSEPPAGAGAPRRARPGPGRRGARSGRRARAPAQRTRRLSS